ncbi:MAG: hypothetical protein H8E66_16390 [Planctomycetes bacterium]|nr:hypothetical protein [Planctomycetota bacterium]
MSTAVKPAESDLQAMAHSGSDAIRPAIVFHGNDNALSIVRSLGRRSIPVYVLNEPNADVQYSRYARRLPISTKLPFPRAAIEFLTGSGSDAYAGAVLLAASDDALQVVAQHRAQLENKFLLDLSNPVAQEQMLDKLATYRIAEAARVPTPQYWQVDGTAELEELRDELVFPLIVKPIHSHLFQRKFKTKFIVVQTYDELLQAYGVVNEAQIEVLLVELIPGPDTTLCSYYTYLDEDESSLFDFTKRIIRRFPTNMGLATYHVTDHVEGVKEPALRLFRQAGLRGLANAEFKYDVRDDTLKLIECNARFTAANALIAKAGLDLSSLVYNRLCDLPLPSLDRYRDNVTLWDPFRDYKAFRELRARGELTTIDWLRGVMRPQMFPGFNWTDPRPGFARLRRRLFKG